MPDSPSRARPVRRAAILFGGLVLLGGLQTACTQSPTFTYERSSGVALENLRRFALNPRRDLAWILEGQRTLPAPEYREAAVRELQAKGFQLVAPEQADVWVEVIVAVPERSPGGASGGGKKGHDKRGGGSGKGMGGEGRGSEGGRGTGSRPEAGPQASPDGEATVIVKLLARTDQRTLWSGSGLFPAADKGSPKGAPDTAEGRVQLLLAPCPGGRPR
ncbi:MAG: hypothetical protein HGB30_01795 [Holophagaceae bacterium]|nr:hypothetical protein [Holophagaceae bacterium]